MTKTKRRKRPLRMKDGELSLSYGYTRDDGEDIYITRGEGVPRPDGHLLHFFFNILKQPGTVLYPEERPCLVDELKARGYDITTIRFTIQKAKVEPQEGK